MHNELIASLRHWRIWFVLNHYETRAAYKRTYLGPLWALINHLFFLSPLCFLYSRLFVTSPEYISYAVTGMLSWGFISQVLTSSPATLIQAAPYLQEIPFPYSLFSLKQVVQRALFFLQSCVIIIPFLYLFSSLQPSFTLFLFIPHLILVTLVLWMVATLLALLSPYFRDLIHFIPRMVNLLFIVTPVLWESSHLPVQYKFWMQINPANILLVFLRKPLMGQWNNSFEWISLLTIILSVGFVLHQVFKRKTNNVIFHL